MSGRIDKKELARRVGRRFGIEPAHAEIFVDAVFEEIYEALKNEERVSVRNFGTFYIDIRRSGTVFKFNPSQRLRALFCWSSTYKGE